MEIIWPRLSVSTLSWNGPNIRLVGSRSMVDWDEFFRSEAAAAALRRDWDEFIRSAEIT